MKDQRAEMIGILGGMGPLASAEFLKTIYEFSLGAREQDSPQTILISDPTFPDRTGVIFDGSDDLLLGKLIKRSNQLLEFGVSKMVICCLSSHYLLPSLPPEIRARILSLLDVIYEDLRRSDKKHLLLCTEGARKARIFQSHEMWNQCRHLIVLPDEDDQKLIHQEIIYKIKQNADVDALVPVIEKLLLKYDVDSFISGCTEIHLAAKQILSPKTAHSPYGCIDPLITIAEKIASRML